MSDPDIKEQEALVGLLESEGWELLMAHLEREWGSDAYAARMDKAIAEAKANRDTAEPAICELGAAVRAVRIFAQWPKTRVAQLKALKEKTTTAGIFSARRRA